MGFSFFFLLEAFSVYLTIGMICPATKCPSTKCPYPHQPTPLLSENPVSGSECLQIFVQKFGKLAKCYTELVQMLIDTLYFPF